MKEFDYFSEYQENPDKATSRLYEKFRSQFMTYISHRFSALSTDDIEDIYVDSVMVAWEKVGRGVLTRENMISAWNTYLIGVGKLKAVHLLSERKEIIEESVDDENAAQIADESESPLRQEVRELLDMLDRKCRELLEQFYVFGYTMEEIAKRMKMANANTAKATKYNCMKRFAELYNKLYGKSSAADLLIDESKALISDMKIEEELIWELKSRQMRGRLMTARRWQRSRTPLLWSVSVAACLAVLVTLGVRDMHQGQGLADVAIAEYEMGEYRGDYDVVRLKDFRDMVKAGVELSAAQDSLESLAVEINGRTYADDLEGYYYMITDRELLEDIEYLQALCTMKQGRMFEARRQLRAIRDKRGLYAMEADKMLKDW